MLMINTHPKSLFFQVSIITKYNIILHIVIKYVTLHTNSDFFKVSSSYISFNKKLFYPLFKQNIQCLCCLYN